MAITQNTYNGNGSNLGPFPFTFKWLESTDIKVSVGGVLKTAGTHYNLQNLNYNPLTGKTGGEVLFTAGNAPPVGTNNIRIYRDTDDEALSAVFSSGSAIRAKDLNDNFTQNLYVTQEVNNNALNVDGSNPMVGPLNMNGFQITNLPVPAVDTNAATKKYVDDRFGNLDIPGHTRWRKVATNGQTTFSGTGDYGGVLGYSPTREQVYINGALQQRGVDYAADNGTSVVFTVGLTVGDVVDIICINNLTNSAISNAGNITYSGQFAGQTARTVAAKLGDIISVIDFGADPTGTNNSTAAIQAALNQLAINGGTLLFSPGTYKLETLNASNAHFSLIDKENITIIGHGATLLSTVTTTGNVFLLDGCRNISIDGLTVVGQFARTGSTINTNSVGVFSLRSSSRDSTCISISNVRASSCYFFLEVSGSSPFTYRVIDFSVHNCLLSGGYYGLNFQNNGDNFSASGFRTNAVLRSYFLYGVDGHNVSYISRNGNALTDCLIKAYDRDTTNIRVKARIISNTSGDAKCTLESQHPPATQPTPATLSNINVDIDDRGSTGAKSVRFAYFQNSTETVSAAYTLFDNICISGSVRNNFDISVVQTPAGRLDISNLDLVDPEIWNNKGFYYLPTEPDSTADPNKMIRGLQIYAANSSAPNPPVAGRSWAGLSAGSDFSTLQLAQDAASLNLYVRNKIGTNSFSSWGLIPDQQSTNWTPSLQFGNVGGNVGMTGTQTGLYVRMGNLVQIWCDINLTNKGTSTGDAFITGLPFNVGGGQYTPINVVFRLGGASLSGPVIGYAESDYIILGQQGATAMTFLNDTNFTNTSRLWLTCTYRTDSAF